MNKLAKLIKAKTGLKFKDFCEKELATEYKTFAARVNNGKLYPSEIFFLVYRTRLSIRELFDKDWQELLIFSQGGGEMTERVRNILSTMTKDEESEIGRLMGMPWGDPEKIKEEREAKPLTEEQQDIRKYPLTEEDLKKIFIQTY